jgi:hypothetical protein
MALEELKKVRITMRLRVWPTIILCAVVNSLSFGIFVSTLRAQNASNSATKPDTPAPSDAGWHVDVIPYIWFSGINGTAGVLGHEASVHASFSDVANYLNLGAMVTVETRYNRFLMPVDFMWIKLSDDKALPFDEGATSVKAEFKQTVFTPGIGYRIVDADRIKVDWRMGIRYWHVNSSLNFQPSTLGKNFSDSAGWVDGISGGKIDLLVTRKVIITFGGDAGGGSARSDYEVFGLLGFRVARKWVLDAGYRYMSVNYRPQSTFVYDMAMSGLVLGATWNAK